MAFVDRDLPVTWHGCKKLADEWLPLVSVRNRWIAPSHGGVLRSCGRLQPLLSR